MSMYLFNGRDEVSNLSRHMTQFQGRDLLALENVCIFSSSKLKTVRAQHSGQKII